MREAREVCPICQTVSVIFYYDIKCIAIRNQKWYNLKRKEVIYMARTSNIYVRVEPNIKEQAEVVLEKLGIPMSNAVSIFLRQVVMQNGLPFEVKIPNTKPISLSNLSEEEFNMEMLKAHNDFENGRTYSFEEVEDELKKEFGR